MGSINSEEIISILKTEIENYDMVTGEQEVGSVIWVGDGIATIYGIEHAMYGEIVIFENGVRGMVQDIKRDQIGCIILGKDTGIKEGTKVTRTKKKAGVPVGNAYLGRIVNALGARSTAREIFRRTITARSSRKRRALLTVSRSSSRSRPVFWRLTPCSRSDAGSGS